MEAKKENRRIMLWYILTLILSFCSIVYELLIAQAVSSLAYNTAVWYSLVVGAYIGAMGVGAIFFRRFLSKDNDPLSALLRVEVFLTLFGFLSVVSVYFSHAAVLFISQKGVYGWGAGFFVFVVFFNVLVIGVLSGAELPLIIDVARRYKQAVKINRMLAADYFGALLGAVSFPLIFFPRFELTVISFLIAGLNLVMAGVLYAAFRHKSRLPGVIFFFMLGLLFTVSASLYFSKEIQQYFLKKYYYYDFSVKDISSLWMPVKNTPRVERYLSSYQKMDLVSVSAYPEPYMSLIKVYSNKFSHNRLSPRDKILFINGSFEFWSNFEEVYHEYFAHVPIQLYGRVPKNILVLGAGDGLLVRELLKYEDIEHITLVELDKTMVDLAQNHPVFRKLNKDAFHSSKIKIIVGDAYYFMKNTKNKFDAVFIDFPSPYDYDVSKLYSQEFYSFVRKSLNPDGFAVLDAPPASPQIALHDVNSHADIYEDWGIYENTFKKAGFKQIVPFYTNLEKDNGQAMEIIWNYLGDTQQMTVRQISEEGEKTEIVQGKKAVTERILSDFVSDYKQRFVFLKNETGLLNHHYKEYGINLHVFNEGRFKLSISDEYTISEKIDLEAVNSIMKPAFAQDFRHLKSPF